MQFNIEGKVCAKHKLRRAAIAVSVNGSDPTFLCTECADDGPRSIEHGPHGPGCDCAPILSSMPPMSSMLVNPAIETTFMEAITQMTINELKLECPEWNDSLANSPKMLRIMTILVNTLGIDATDSRQMLPLLHVFLAAYKTGKVTSLGSMSTPSNQLLM